MNTIRQAVYDEAIRSAVADELEWTPDVNALRIGVSVDEGVVTLSGEVSTSSERIAAKDAALRVKGVTAVADDLVVAHSVTHPTDTEIAGVVSSTLRWADDVPHDAVKVEVRDGVVVLTGEVLWEHQRRAASRAVQRLTGVRKVDNRMTLKRRPSGTDTRERIEKALIRNAIVESNAIEVTVEGNTVTLTGTVGSWAEKTQAGLAAWSSPHVDRVNNQIVVGPM